MSGVLQRTISKPDLSFDGRFAVSDFVSCFRPAALRGVRLCIFLPGRFAVSDFESCFRSAERPVRIPSFGRGFFLGGRRRHQLLPDRPVVQPQTYIGFDLAEPRSNPWFKGPVACAKAASCMGNGSAQAGVRWVIGCHAGCGSWRPDAALIE